MAATFISARLASLVLLCMGAPLALGQVAAPPANPNAPRLVVQTGHSRQGVAVAWSGDGRQILTANQDTTAILWDATTGRQLRQFQGHTEFIADAALSADGRYAVIGSGDKSATIWDVNTGSIVHRLEGHQDVVSAVAISTDGKRVMTGSWDDTVRVWDLLSGKMLKSLDGHRDVINAVAFSPDGKLLVTTCDDRLTRVFSDATGKEVHRFAGHSEPVMDVRFSPDGKRLVTAGGDAKAIIWELATGARTDLKGHLGWLMSAAFSPDGRQIVTAAHTDDNSAILWDVATGTKVRVVATSKDGIKGVAFSPNGTQLVTIENSPLARIWDVGTGNLVRPLEGLQRTARVARLSPDGKRFAVTFEDEKPDWIWTTGRAKPLLLDSHAGGGWSLSFSSDSSRILSKPFGRIAYVWDLAGGKELHRVTLKETVEQAALFPDGKRVLVCSGGEAFVVNVETGQTVARFAGNGDVHRVFLSSDGLVAVTVSPKSSRSWDANTGNPLHQAGLRVAAITADGQRFAAVTTEKSVVVHEFKTGKLLQEFRGPTNTVHDVAFSPNGQQIAVACEDGTLRQWDLLTGKLLGAWTDKFRWVRKVSYTPNGRAIVGVGDDGAIQFRDSATGDEIGQLIVTASGDWIAVTAGMRYDSSNPDSLAAAYWVIGKAVVDLRLYKARQHAPGLLVQMLDGRVPSK